MDIIHVTANELAKLVETAIDDADTDPTSKAVAKQWQPFSARRGGSSIHSSRGGIPE
jgi:hypothetical protein